MLPILGSGIFTSPQIVDWNVVWYDSSMTVPETGIGFKLGNPSSSFTHNGMLTAVNPSVYLEANSTPVITTGAGAWKFGRTALVQEFWEGGALPGITKSRYAVMHWRGFLTASANRSWIDGVYGKYFLALSGKGNVRVFVGGTEVLTTKRLSDAGIITTSLITASDSQQIDIYYWQLGEDWGGIVCKYVPQTRSTQTSASLDEYRQSPVLSASLAPYTTASAVTLQRVLNARLDISSPLDTTTFTFSVPLTPTSLSLGWKLLTSPRRLSHYDGTTTINLKVGQLIQFSGGTYNETYRRFTGTIVDFEESDGKVTVSCKSHESRLSEVNVQNYPDRLSYCTFGYFRTSSTSEPIKNIFAYDAWPLEYAIKDLIYRAKIDSKMLYGVREYELNRALATKYIINNTNTVYDSFTGSNGTALSSHNPDLISTKQNLPWTNVGSVTIQSNKASTSSTSNSLPRLEADYPNLYRISALFNWSATSASGEARLLFRGASGASYTGYAFGATRTSTTLVTMSLQRYSSGSVAATPYSSASYSWAANTEKKLIVEVEGTTYRLYIAASDGSNEILLTTITDANVATTNSFAGFLITAASGQTTTAEDFTFARLLTVDKTASRNLYYTPIKLQRNSKYGNAGSGFSPNKPEDDTYMYSPRSSSSVLDYAKTLSDAFLYDFRADAYGYIILAPRNNPKYVVDYTEGTTTYHPSAYGGFYQKITSGFTTYKIIYGTRIDLVLGRKTGLGVISYSVKSADGTITYASGTIDLASGGTTDGILYFDGRYAVTGTNSAVVTLFSGDWKKYLVTISNSSGSEWWLDSLFIYDFDPVTPRVETLLTTKQVTQLSTASLAEDIRNVVSVIGKRKAAITDSTKYKNPNNPENEFFVSLGADPYSMWDYEATNFLGRTKAIFISDTRISDQDYADWLAQTLLIRQRDPGPSASITHTILPFLEPRDPIRVSDEAYATIGGSHKLWVVSISEDYTEDSAITTIGTTAYPEIPSYEPRKDLDLTIIDSQFGGDPAISFGITYPSIDSGTTVTNPSDDIVKRYLINQSAGAAVLTDGNGSYIDCTGLAWPPIPDSIAIDTTGSTPVRSVSIDRLKNNPYMKLIHIYDYSVKRIHLPFLAGDGSSVYSTRSNWLGGSNFVTLKYKGIDPTISLSNIYSGTSPFYDPYISELPGDNLVKISFDALVSGYYRASVFAEKGDGTESIRVAWLTEPGIDSDDLEAHWQYLPSGKSKLFLWDGVDNIGTWNKIQSEQYSWTARGIFEAEQMPSIGKGFYVWNDKTTAISTISGQSSSGKLVFNDDNYSRFYVKVECKSDLFIDSSEQIREVVTTELRTTGSQNPKTRLYIYTYLPPPTKVKISSVEEWDPTVSTWSRDNPSEAGWDVYANHMDAAGTVRNGKPIRFTFTSVARPGVKFAGDITKTTFKMHRMVHLKANIMDMFMMFLGKPWYPTCVAEQKRLVSRRTTNDQFTIDFADTDYRTGDSLSTSDGKWVFEPKDFKIGDVSIRYADVLQLGEDIPSFTASRSVGQESSRFIIGYINYLFYLSAYVQDRSGRMVWAIDDTFIDKLTNLANTFATTFPEDLENYFNRTIYTRQWVDPSYVDTLATKWTIPTTEKKYIQFYHDRLEWDDINASSALRIDSAGAAVNGNLLTAYNDWHTQNSVSYSTYTINSWRQLGSWSSPSTLNSYFGEWIWEGKSTGGVEATTDGSTVDPLWIPCPSRDWHPYYLLPPMPGLQTRSRNGVSIFSPYVNYAKGDIYGYVNYHDDAWGEVWQTVGRPMINSDNSVLELKMPSDSVEDYVKDGKDKKATSGMFNYTRQIEQTLWEHTRGMRTKSKNEGSTSTPNFGLVISTASSGPYYINTFRYDTFEFARINTSLNKDENNIYTKAQISTTYYNPGGGWFNWEFFDKYNWYSPSYFPVTATTGALNPTSLYTKYSVDTPSNNNTITYDYGAWAGFKPDIPVGVGGTHFLWKYGSLGGTNGGSVTPKNIFTMKHPPYAIIRHLGTNVLKRAIMTLYLLNNRRGSPVSGK